jgi:hypothetical protein
MPDKPRTRSVRPLAPVSHLETSDGGKSQDFGGCLFADGG